MNSKIDFMIQKPLQISTFEPILRWPSEESKTWLQNLVLELEQNPKVCSVLAIGSAIRKGVRSADLDLVVLFSGQTPKLAIPPIDVDLRTYSLDDVETLVQQGHDLLGWTVKYGKPLFDKGDVWHHLAQSLRPVLPLPPSDVALERAAKTEAILQTLLEIGDQDAAQEQLLSLLTHLSRACLAWHGVYPASRPELPRQLRQVNKIELAQLLEQTLEHEGTPNDIYRNLKKLNNVIPVGPNHAAHLSN